MKKSAIETINNVMAFGIMAASTVYGFKKEYERSGKKNTKKTIHPRNQKLAKLGDYYVTQLCKTGNNENYLELRKRNYDAECCDTTLALKLTDDQLYIISDAKHACVNDAASVFTCKGGFIYEWFGTDGIEGAPNKKHDERFACIDAQVSVLNTIDFAVITISYYEKIDDEKRIRQNFAIKLDYREDMSEFRALVDRSSLV